MRFARLLVRMAWCVPCLALCLGGPRGRAAETAPGLALKLLAEGLTAPIGLCSLPDGSGRLLVADQAGMIHLLNREGKREEKLFLDLRAKIVKLHAGMDERGLIGLALHPQFKANRKFYVTYSAPRRPGAPAADWDHTMLLSEFRASEQEPPAAVESSERVVLEIHEPDWHHNSGRLAFGPDGYLYISAGDGGAANDVGVRGHAPEGNGQHLQTLLGKILRIDVDKQDAGLAYAIPSDNPFADGQKGRPEIYAYGLRNPWGMSFDRGGHRELIVTDVGQELWEEINIIVKGGNYGWRVREGFVGFDHQNPKVAPAQAPGTDALGRPFIDPVLVYKTARGVRPEPGMYGVSITGGYVYRGKALPQLTGKYVFADWSLGMGVGNGILLIAERPASGSGQWTAQPLPVKDHPDGRVKAFIWSLGEDDNGEIYVMTNGANMVSGTRGKVYKLVPAM